MKTRSEGQRTLPVRFALPRTIVLVKKAFNHAADGITRALGSPFALLLAALTIVVWAMTGPGFGFSDTWQLVINTGTTIVTFLMVFVIQNSQNRDAKAVHIKLDELIRAMEGARNSVALAEQETEDEQDQQIREMETLAHEAERESASAAAVANDAKHKAREAEASAERATSG